MPISRHLTPASLIAFRSGRLGDEPAYSEGAVFVSANFRAMTRQPPPPTPLRVLTVGLTLLSIAYTLAGCSLLSPPERYEPPTAVPSPTPVVIPAPAPAPIARPPEPAKQNDKSTSPAATESPNTPLPPTPAISTRHYQLSPATTALLAQAHAASLKGDNTSASSTLERAVHIEPLNPLVWIEMAKIKLAMRDFTQAESVSKKAIALSEGDQRTSNEAWKTLALALKGLNRGAEAAAAEARSNRPYTDNKP